MNSASYYVGTINEPARLTWVKPMAGIPENRSKAGGGTQHLIQAGMANSRINYHLHVCYIDHAILVQIVDRHHHSKRLVDTELNVRDARNAIACYSTRDRSEVRRDRDGGIDH